MSIKVINNQATCANLKRMLEEKGLTPNDVKEKLDLQCTVDEIVVLNDVNV